MPAVIQTEQELADRIEQVFNDTSDVAIDPAEGRRLQAEGIAKAIVDFTVGRETIVSGTSQTGGAVTGQGIIQQ